jgi:hypothetical protein
MRLALQPIAEASGLEGEDMVLTSFTWMGLAALEGDTSIGMNTSTGVVAGVTFTAAAAAEAEKVLPPSRDQATENLATAETVEAKVAVTICTFIPRLGVPWMVKALLDAVAEAYVNAWITRLASEAMLFVLLSSF